MNFINFWWPDAVIQKGRRVLKFVAIKGLNLDVSRYLAGSHGPIGVMASNQRIENRWQKKTLKMKCQNLQLALCQRLPSTDAWTAADFVWTSYGNTVQIGINSLHSRLQGRIVVWYILLATFQLVENKLFSSALFLTSYIHHIGFQRTFVYW